MRRMELEMDFVPTPQKGVVVRTPWQRRILTFVMVFDPGLIDMGHTAFRARIRLSKRSCRRECFPAASLLQIVFRL